MKTLEYLLYDRWVEEEGDYRDDITVIVLSNLSSLFLPSDITG